MTETDEWGVLSLAEVFFNPIVSNGADPWVIQHQGNYYYTHTTGSDIQLWKSATLTGIPTGEHKVIWTPPAKGAYSQNIWKLFTIFWSGMWTGCRKNCKG